MRTGMILVACGAALLWQGYAWQAWGQEETPGVAKMVREKRQVVESKYYTIVSDAEPRVAIEAAPQLTAMIEMYLEAVKAAGAKGPKMNIRLFNTDEGFMEATGTRQVRACVGRNGVMVPLKDGHILWEDLQCQAFYHFQRNSGAGLPEWVEWWLAEYLALAQYTGDGYVTGAMKPLKVLRLQGYIKGGKIRPLRTIMEKGPLYRGTRDEMVADWDGAWGIMHYLMQAQDGKYRKQWDGFLKGLGERKTWQESWKAQFGDNIEGLEKECWAWWMNVTQEDAQQKYTEATVATLTSYLARAESAGQTFGHAKEFLAAAKAGNLEHASPEQELPDELLQKAIQKAVALSDWSLEAGKTGSQLVLRTKDGMTYRGSFVLEKTKIKKVSVEVTKGEN